MNGVPLERITRLVPLGLEFRDAASGRRVGDGLVVRVAPKNRPQRGVLAQPNPSGIFVAHDLPGLRDWSHGGAEPQPHPEFEIEVEDRLGRFLPTRLRLALPERGLAHAACRDDIPLLSAPTRSVPGLASLRADLFDLASGLPAAWAVAEVRHLGARLCLGMADGRGRLLLAFPYPEPALSNQPLAATTWPLTLHVQYQPGLDPARPPELCQALAQPAARFVEVAEPLATLAELALTLRAGQELRAAYPACSLLHITP